MSLSMGRSARAFQPSPRGPHRRTGSAACAGCRLAGVGSSAPPTILTNDDLEKMVETNDEWIATRTGIRQRHVLANGELISEHSVASARAALDMAGVAASEVDMILLATSSPDDLFGSATYVRKPATSRKAGTRRGAGFLCSALLWRCREAAITSTGVWPLWHDP
jgi:hypothetical protein